VEIQNNVLVWYGMEFDIWIIIMTWIVMELITALALLAYWRLSWIPKGWQNLMEMAVEFVENAVRDNLGPNRVKYTYFFGSLFLFIFCSNMLGLIPGLASPTRSVSVTLGLSFLVVIWMQYIGVKENGFLRYLKHFLSPNPAFLPLHLMELVTRPLTLALRLFGNIFAGEILIEELTKIFYIGIPSIWLLMSVLIGAIQAYIFTVLSLAYTGLSIEDKH